MSNSHGFGHNVPPLQDQLEVFYSAPQLAQDHAALAMDVQRLALRAGQFTAVDSAEDTEAATALVVELRALATKVDETAEAVKAAPYRAYKNVLDFFTGLNNSDTKRPGALTASKLRLERLIRDYGFKVAAEERRIAEEAAQRERDRLAAEQAAAAKLEAEGHAAAAEVVIEQAVKTERFSEVFQARADGPVQELARQRTAAGTAGLRKVPGHEFSDRAAFVASLGPLGPYLKGDALDQAIRAFRAAATMAFETDDTLSPKRYLTSDPALPGVRFFLTYEGNVHA